MAPRMTYLAYPIDQVNADLQAMYDDITEAKDRLRDGGVDVLFDPGDAFSVRAGSAVGPEIAAINMMAAAQADSVMAWLPAGVPTVGVPIEIDRAVRAGKWVAVLTNAQAWMLNYDGIDHVRRFPLTWEGMVEATNWFAGVERLEPSGSEPEPLPFLNLEGRGTLPSRSHDDDAGLDLYVSEDTWLYPGQAIDIPCAVAVELPSWSWGLIIGRSSARRVRGLLVHQGVIDPGYRGELFICAENLTTTEVQVKAGERIGQLIILPNVTKDFAPVEAETLNPSVRGSSGFGSTGR